MPRSYEQISPFFGKVKYIWVSAQFYWFLKKITILEPESIDLEAQWFAPIGKTTFWIKKVSLHLSIAQPLSFSCSLFYPLPPVRVGIVAAYFWFCGNLGSCTFTVFSISHRVVNRLLSVSRKLTFSFPQERTLVICRHSPHRELSNWSMVIYL